MKKVEMKKNEAISILVTSVRPREPKDKARYEKAVKMAVDALKEPERKKGKWIKDGHHIQCNQCGISICDKDREGDVLPKNFCPNCGADMREKVSE